MNPPAPVIECAFSSRVHVCAFAVSRYTRRLDDLAARLSPEDRARAYRFHREADRNRFILGRAVVRHLCGVYLGVEPVRIRLAQTPAGKPYLAGPVPPGRLRFEFSVAHSGDCVLVGWAEGLAVGVDVETLVADASPALAGDISARAFSRDEREVLSAAAPDKAADTFYRIWVRKEAVLKAEGCGLGGALESFSVARRQPGGTEWLDEVLYIESGRRWRLVDVLPAPGYLAGVALPQGSVIYQCTASELGALD